MASTDAHLEKLPSLLGGAGVLALHMASADVTGGVTLLSLDSAGSPASPCLLILDHSTGKSCTAAAWTGGPARDGQANTGGEERILNASGDVPLPTSLLGS